MTAEFKDKRILVTGACGTVGRELVRQLLQDDGIDEVIGIDNNETELFFVDQEFLADRRARFFLADIGDRSEITRRMRGIDIVFHTAAFKHVIMCERSPEQAVSTNILGVQNLVAAALENDVERVIFTSSDKAVNPTSVMGTSKLMGERLMTAANSNKRVSGPVFASTRFGNVLGSSGSVVPIFHNQIARGGPVTLTHPDMTRFVMSIEQAVALVIRSAGQARGGEVFVTKMPVVRIADLAAAMIEELGPKYGFEPARIEISEIGVKPGEKLFEELMSLEETGRALELKEFFSVLPAFRGIYHDIDYDYPDILQRSVDNPYISMHETPLTVDQIKQLLNSYDLLTLPEEKSTSRYWPGDKETDL